MFPTEAAIATYELSCTLNSKELSSLSYTYGVKPVIATGAHVLVPGGISWAVCTDTSAAYVAVGKTALTATIPTPIRRVARSVRIAIVFLMPVTLVRESYFRQGKNVLQY